MSRPADELPVEFDDGGAAPGARVVPPDQHPWAPTALTDYAGPGVVDSRPCPHENWATQNYPDLNAIRQECVDCGEFTELLYPDHG